LTFWTVRVCVCMMGRVLCVWCVCVYVCMYVCVYVCPVGVRAHTINHVVVLMEENRSVRVCVCV